MSDESLSPQAIDALLEAALLSATRPLPAADLVLLFDGQVSAEEVSDLLAGLALRYASRGVELTQGAEGWRFRVREEVARQLDRLHPSRSPKYSAAVLQTLAVIAYRQPVTRADIEDLRGVSVSGGIIRQLQERGWVEVIGHREGEGRTRAELFATTSQFLQDLGVGSLMDLPPVEAGQLEAARGEDDPDGLEDEFALTPEVNEHVPDLTPAGPDDSASPSGDHAGAP